MITLYDTIVLTDLRADNKVYIKSINDMSAEPMTFTAESLLSKYDWQAEVVGVRPYLNGNDFLGFVLILKEPLKMRI
jgi:hypothetical protein